MSTLHVSIKTHRRVLLQPAALEDVVADNQQGTDETGHITFAQADEAGVQHGRGETFNARLRGLGEDLAAHADGLGREPHIENEKLETRGKATRRVRNKTNSNPANQPRVFVVSRDEKPLDPTTPRRARLLLDSGRAVAHKMSPFVIRIKDRHSSDSQTQGVVVGVDPGSKTTGIAVWMENTPGVREAVFLAEVEHRGALISKKLEQRSNYRRRRRSKNLRYRAPRFLNRTKPKGWLAPSLQHRVDTTYAWVARIARWAPIQGIEMELVRFDMQVMQNPKISGTEYQQGELAGYETREYLLEKWSRTCVYCDARDVPLQVEHITPKAHGGSNRVSNLTIACGLCNRAKGSMRVEDFVTDPARLVRITKYAKTPLRDAAAVNATRNALKRELEKIAHVNTCTGGQTKYNRSRFGLPKTHCLDALALGNPDSITSITGWEGMRVLAITCNGRGQYQRTKPDTYGFPRLIFSRQKSHYGFATGNRIVAVVPVGKHMGVHVGRVAIRKTGSFNITTTAGTLQGISHKYCTVLQRGDGYGYLWKEVAFSSPPLRTGSPNVKIR